MKGGGLPTSWDLGFLICKTERGDRSEEPANEAAQQVLHAGLTKSSRLILKNHTALPREQTLSVNSLYLQKSLSG